MIYGIHAVHAYLSSLTQTTVSLADQLFVQEGRQDKRFQNLIHEANSLGIPIKVVSRKMLTQMCDAEQHQGVVLDTPEDAIHLFGEKDIPHLLAAGLTPPLVLICDGIQDPHNLGACCRSADAAGVACVIIPKDKNVSITSTVRKVACGATETTPIVQVTNLVRVMKQLQEEGVWLYGLAGEANATLFDTQLTGPVGLVMGSEGKGLRRLTREHCDELVSIPMQGSVSSLNVSVATGIALFEVLRQRGRKAGGQILT